MSEKPKTGTPWFSQSRLWIVERVDGEVHVVDPDDGTRRVVPIDAWPIGFQPAWPPRVGDLLDFVVDGQRDPDLRVRVTEVAPIGVKLVDLSMGEQLFEYRDAWPGSFRPVLRERDLEQRRPIVAALVGGDGGKYLQRVRQMAESLNVDIAYHMSRDQSRWEKKGWTFPAGVELVILLVSHIGHPAYYAARDAARSDAIPIAEVPFAGFKEVFSKYVGTFFPDRLSGSEGYGATFDQPVWTWRDGGWTAPDPIVEAPAWVWQDGVWTIPAPIDRVPEPPGVDVAPDGGSYDGLCAMILASVPFVVRVFR